MKKYLIPLFLLLLLAFSAGCIQPTDPVDPVIGTWVSGEYTNLAGTHYTKMVETFNEDYTITETLYGADGTVVTTSSVWIKKDIDQYESYYAPVTFNYNPTRNTAEISCEFFSLEDTTVSRSDSGTGIVGIWTNDEPHEIMENIYYVQFDIQEGGSGTVTYIEEDLEKNGSSKIYWYGLGENMYVITITDPVEWRIGDDGKLHDNYGCVYEKEV